jgi:hypothetical protein
MAKKKPQGQGLRCRQGIWYVNIQVDGKRKEFRVGPSREEAVAARSRLKLMALNGSLQEHLKEQEQPPFSFSEAIQEHWDAHLKHKKSGADMLKYLNGVKKLFGSRDIRTLRWQEIEAYRNERLAKVSPSWVKKELVMMGAVLQRQIKMERLKMNP